MGHARLVPPPPAPWRKPSKMGEMIGGLGLGPAISEKLRPHPACNLMLLFASRNVLVPPTPVTKGESALAYTETAGMPKSLVLVARLSPLSPVETFCEIPNAAAISEIPFSTGKVS